MNLLYDFITLSNQTGAGVYAHRVFGDLLNHVICNSANNINLFALYDSTIGIAYDDLTEEAMSNKYNIMYCDINEKDITKIISDSNIDVFFIACSQYVGLYPHISEVKCRVVCVTHDLCFEEWYQNNLNLYFYQMQIGFKWPKIGTNFIELLLKPKNDITRLIKWIIEELINHSSENLTHKMKGIIELARNNENVQLITVSDYTRISFLYNYGIDKGKVKVLWSPARECVNSQWIVNPGLKYVLEKKLRYILMVSANRSHKNCLKVINAFTKFSEYNKDYYLVTIGYGKQTSERHIDLDYLSDGDLTHAFANCDSLIYPSFFEGFGYPPIEAMKYGKPVLCSNTTSMPEILGDAPIFFSPIYETSIFDALLNYSMSDYEALSCRSRERYDYISQKQDSDLKELISMLVTCK